ncbi:MAG: carbamoyltransferase C-terminal domain-containing protein [Vicinamibacterales bacterium]
MDGHVRAACEQERLTRVRGVGLAGTALPVEAVDGVMALAHCRPDDVTTYVVAEPEVRLPAGLRTWTVDHHQAHAATAFLTSPFERAAVLVCDSESGRELSVWSGNGNRVVDLRWPWRGGAFASLFAQCAELFAPGSPARAYEMEVLAHLGRGDGVERLRNVFRLDDDCLDIDSRWREHVARMIEWEGRPPAHAAETASAVQRRIGDLLLELLGEIRATVGADALCVAGGFFYNTYFTTLVRTSGIFERTFVPINPGNAGLCVGAALMLDRENGGGGAARTVVSPFLGPSYDSETIKATLDGCKLSYEFVSENDAIDAAVAALGRGELVGWFQGRMEWGHRALGHRSILADACSPYVLDNLNSFLRKRERSRPFGLAACDDAVPKLLCGPSASPFMEYEYRPRDDRFRHVLPPGATSIRVQTVPADAGPFRRLLETVEQATGTGALVNTSFNGFNEPIVCNPRDAIRVFFGTGLDLLVIGQFILRK